jgi:hypothetical protein
MTDDEIGRFKVGGAYDHTGRKVGYDAADMKNGISDVNAERFQDSRHVARENEYLNMHPIGNSKVPSHSHPGGREELLNNHGGTRTANHVRTDIRHGLNILREKHPKGVEGGHLLSTAESVGYNARKHHYVRMEHEAFMQTPAGRTKAANDARAAASAGKKYDVWGQEESPKPAPSAPAPAVTSSKKTRTKTKLPNDTLRAGVKEMVKRVLPRKAK